MNTLFYSAKISICTLGISLSTLLSASAQTTYVFTKDQVGFCTREALREHAKLTADYSDALAEARGQYGYQDKVRAVENYYEPRLDSHANYLQRKNCGITISEGNPAIILDRFEADAPASFDNYHNIGLSSLLGASSNTYNVVKVKLLKYDEIWYAVDDPGLFEPETSGGGNSNTSNGCEHHELLDPHSGQCKPNPDAF
jgi:hypothetical protein